MSIAQNIIEILEGVLQQHPEYRIEKVYVDIGEGVAVVPESLQFCYNAIIEETPLIDSQLIINIIPIQAFCRACQKEIRLESFQFLCPECGGSDLQEISGRELSIKHLEVA